MSSPSPTVPPSTWIAFSGPVRVARDAPLPAVLAAKAYADLHPAAPILIFDATTSAQIDIDLSVDAEHLKRIVVYLERHAAPAAAGAEALAVASAQPPAPRGAGRPKLGVVPREVTLLPRHWEWLARQQGGASVALRKLVEQALRAHRDDDARRAAREAAYKFMTAMAGDAPHYEEALRALFAGDDAALVQHTSGWASDVRAHALALAGVADA